MSDFSLVRFAVVGAGSIGREFALRHLVKNNGAEVVAIVDQNVEMAANLATDVQFQKAGAKIIGTKPRAC